MTRNETRPTRRRHTRSPYTGTCILDVLAARGVPQAWVARKMKVHPQHFNRVVNGLLPISNEFVAGACEVLQLPPAALFFSGRDLLDVNQSGVSERIEETAHAIAS